MLLLLLIFPAKCTLALATHHKYWDPDKNFSAFFVGQRVRKRYDLCLARGTYGVWHFYLFASKASIVPFNQNFEWTAHDETFQGTIWRACQITYCAVWWQVNWFYCMETMSKSSDKHRKWPKMQVLCRRRALKSPRRTTWYTTTFESLDPFSRETVSLKVDHKRLFFRPNSGITR